MAEDEDEVKIGDAEHDDHEIVKDRRADFSKKKKNKETLLKLYVDIQKGFQDQVGRSGDINEYWDCYNCILGNKQSYSGENELFIPAIYNAVEARITRFSNQLFPTSGRHLEVVSSDATRPRAMTALGEHYIRKSKLRLLVPALLLNGDVEGHYWTYVSWSTRSRHVIKKAKVPVEDPQLGVIGEIEDLEEEEIFSSHPIVEVLSDCDVVVLPSTADSLDDALDQGGSITILRRWTESKIEELIDDGLIDDKRGGALIKEMSKQPATNFLATEDREKKAVWAAGIKGAGRAKHALVYETWTKKIDGKLTQTFYGSSDLILHCHRNPLWCDRLPLIGYPSRKVHGVYKGRSAIAAVADLQYFINDIANEAADSSNRAMVPIVLTDPLQNPRYDSMVIAQGAVWKTSPQSTKILEFPQLWKDGGAIILQAQSDIMQTLGVNPAMITQGFRKSKPSQAEVAQEHAVDLLTTANAVTVIEEGILTPIVSLFMEMDHQYRNEAITVKAYGELGQKAAMETIEPIQMDARYFFRWLGVEQARNAQQLQQQIALVNVARSIPGQLYPNYVLDLAPILVDLFDSTFGALKGRVVFKEVNDPQTQKMKTLQMLLAGAAGGSPGAGQAGKQQGGKAGGGQPRPGAQPGAGRPAQNPVGMPHQDQLGAPGMPRKVGGMM